MLPARAMVESPHDKLFKEALGNLENAAALLRAVLPASLLSGIDLTSLALVPGTFLHGKLARSASDLLFSTKFNKRRVLIYLLFEHKSHPDRWVPFQLLRYCVRIWERCLDTSPRIKHLPPVLPILVHHSKSGFRGSTAFLDILEPLVSQTPELLRLTPKFEFLVDDFSHRSDTELFVRSLNTFGLLAMFALRDGRDPERLRRGLTRWGKLFTALLQHPDGERALELIFRYLLQVSGLGLTTIQRAIRSAPPQVGHAVMTVAEQLRKEGRKQGVQVGRKQGLQVGRKQGVQVGILRGQRKLLAKLLRAKFGPLDAATVEALKHADEPALARYAKRVLTAPSLNAVFDE